MHCVKKCLIDHFYNDDKLNMSDLTPLLNKDIVHDYKQRISYKTRVLSVIINYLTDMEHDDQADEENTKIDVSYP